MKNLKKNIENGFSLLEVIMAMVVLSASLLPLFAIFGNYLNAMRNMSNENEKAEARTQILSYMNGVNPFVDKEGNLELGDFTFSWNATPIVENIENIDSNNGRINKANFKITLYDTHINASKPNNAEWLEFTIRQIGYEKTQETSMDTMPMDEDESDMKNEYKIKKKEEKKVNMLPLPERPKDNN